MVGHAAHMVEVRNVYRLLVQKCEKKTQKDNIKIDIKEM
jgi:hypothetical protein